MFRNNKEYVRIGTPRTLSFLLYGPPGTGKTAFIKALANETKRHIVKIELRMVSSCQDLEKLLFDPHYLMVDFGCGRGSERVYIPMRDRLYVFEEVDLQTDIVHRRRGIDENGNQMDDDDSDHEEQIQDKARRERRLCDDSGRTELGDEANDSFSLKDLLEILDGLREMDERMITFTTNREHILDPALRRPGRSYGRDPVSRLYGRVRAFSCSSRTSVHKTR